MVYGMRVTLGEVDYMYEVALAGAVGCVVIVTEDLQLG